MRNKYVTLVKLLAQAITEYKTEQKQNLEDDVLITKEVNSQAINYNIKKRM